MSRTTAGGEGLLAAFAASVANLAARAGEVDALNVFPVPDGDTGSNMLATVRAALAEAQAVPAADRSVQRIGGAISFGALMGARGNSGVILSQIFRGMSDVLSGKQRFNGVDLAEGLRRGQEAARASVAKPVEGTILTVISDAAAAATLAAARAPDLESVLTAAVDAAAQAVARTPSLLPVLRESGVVDAGGQGLYLVLQGALLHIQGASPIVEHGLTGAAAAASHPAPAVPAEKDFGYETMYLLTAGERPLDPTAIRSHLESIGDSVMVGGDGRAVKVHVHNERPDAVIAYGLSHGTLSQVSIENLDDQTRDVRETRARERIGGQKDRARPFGTSAGSRPEARQPAGALDAAMAIAPMIDKLVEVAMAEPPASTDPDKAAAPSLSIIAVAAGDGLIRVFDGFGVERIVQSGPAGHPSTGELLEAIQATIAAEVLVLPNHPDVALAADQAAAQSVGKRVVVVPTRNAAEGFAALLARDPRLDAIADREPMLRAARSIQTIRVTEATRDARIAGRKVKKGHAVVLDPDDGLLATHKDRLRATVAAVRTLGSGFELLTLYYGEGVDEEEAQRLARLLAEDFPRVEVDVEHGGQPDSSYLISAE